MGSWSHLRHKLRHKVSATISRADSIAGRPYNGSFEDLLTLVGWILRFFSLSFPHLYTLSRQFSLLSLHQIHQRVDIHSSTQKRNVACGWIFGQLAKT